MPSRRKKALRDGVLTLAFFDQGNPGVGPSGAGRNHSHAATSAAESDPSETSFVEVREMAETDDGAGAETLRAGMESVWQEKFENLTADEIEGLDAAVERESVVSDPRSTLRALRLVYEEMKEMPAAADGSQTMETFELYDLDEVAERYDELCQKYKNKEEGTKKILAELILKSASIANDTTRSAEDRLAAELDMHVLNVNCKLIVPLTSCLRQIQLFVIGKKFGCVEESYAALSIKDWKRPWEETSAELPPSFRQMLNDPFKPAETAPKPRQKNGQKKGKKKRGELTALAELQRNMKLALEDIQSAGKATSDTEDFGGDFPSPAPTSTYAGVPIPKDIPEHVQQRFIDAEFAFEQIFVLHDKISEQLLRVRSAFVAWHSAGREVWDASKKCIHEIPLLREYEHIRISLHAMLILVARQEVKIVEYYSSKGAPKFPPAMSEAFRLKSMSLEEFEKDWEMRRLKLHDALPSVDTMIAGIDNLPE